MFTPKQEQEHSRKNLNLPPLAKSPQRLHGSSKKQIKESHRSSLLLSRGSSIIESVNLINEDESTALQIENVSKFTSEREQKHADTDNFTQSSTRNISTFDRKTRVQQMHQQTFGGQNQPSLAPVKKKMHHVSSCSVDIQKFSPFRYKANMTRSYKRNLTIYKSQDFGASQTPNRLNSILIPLTKHSSPQKLCKLKIKKSEYLKCNEKLTSSDPDFSRTENFDLEHTMKAAKLREQIQNNGQRIIIKKLHKNQKKQVVNFDENIIKEINTKIKNQNIQNKIELMQDLINHLNQQEQDGKNPLIECLQSFHDEFKKSANTVQIKRKKKGHRCFQEEFMQNYDNFSQSWRDQINRQHGTKKNGKYSYNDFKSTFQ